MGAPQFVLRIIVATIAVLTVGTIAVFGFKPSSSRSTARLASPRVAWSGVGSGPMLTVTFASIAFVGMLLFIVIWLVSAPIRNDRRQGYR